MPHFMLIIPMPWRMSSLRVMQKRCLWHNWRDVMDVYGIYLIMGYINPKKQKIRFAFDCGASYQGTSLNEYLLQGPDLISSLVSVLIRSGGSLLPSWPISDLCSIKKCSTKNVKKSLLNRWMSMSVAQQ